MNEWAILKWHELVALLQASRVLTVRDLTELELICDLYGLIAQKRSVGDDPPVTVITRLQGLLSDFGLNPSARHKVSTVGESEEADPWDELMPYGTYHRRDR